MMTQSSSDKEFEKIQDSPVIRSFRKLVIQGKFLTLIQSLYRNPTARIRLNKERQNASFFILSTKQGCLFLPLLFSIVLEILASVRIKGNNTDILQKQDVLKFIYKKRNRISNRWKNFVKGKEEESAQQIFKILYSQSNKDYIVLVDIYQWIKKNRGPEIGSHKQPNISQR